jgi:hypothetical protein
MIYNMDESRFSIREIEATKRLTIHQCQHAPAASSFKRNQGGNLRLEWVTVELLCITYLLAYLCIKGSYLPLQNQSIHSYSLFLDSVFNLSNNGRMHLRPTEQQFHRLF